MPRSQKNMPDDNNSENFGHSKEADPPDRRIDLARTGRVDGAPIGYVVTPTTSGNPSSSWLGALAKYLSSKAQVPLGR